MKRILLSVFLSFIGPGLGQIYNRETKKGVLLLLISSILFLMPLIWLMAQIGPEIKALGGQTPSPEWIQAKVLAAIKKDSHVLNLISFTFLGLWAYAITQAYFKAKEIKDEDKTEGTGTGGVGIGV
ncbi:MAG: hypothetical protein HYY07_04150 [Elusimicrobia bacterium]|nr:hypothetical protein [Elusimicrobiota bacterium]